MLKTAAHRSMPARWSSYIVAWLLTFVLVGSPASARQADSLEQRTAAYFERVRNDPVQRAIFLRAMPKGGDLHSHLSGAVYAETYVDWAAEEGLCVDVTSWSLARPPCAENGGRPPAALALQDFALRDRLIDMWSMRNWTPADGSGHARFFGSFNRFRLVSVRTGDMLAETVARAADNGVHYLELMFTPDVNGAQSLGNHVGFDADLDALREKLLQAGMRDTVRKARRVVAAATARHRELNRCDAPAPAPACSVTIRFLYQVGRTRSPEQVFAQMLLGFELATDDDAVVGINLVQPEDDRTSMRDFSLHMRMIGHLARLYPRVGITLHAGELAPGLVPPEGLRFHIRESVEVAGATRIGHGVSIAHENDPVGLLQELARRRVLVEIALGSNDAILGIRGRDHPLRLYLEHGVPVTLVTDDEGVLRSDMTQEYIRAVVDHGLDYPTLKRIARNSIEYAFADAATKARLLRELEQSFTAFEQRFAAPRS